MAEIKVGDTVRLKDGRKTAEVRKVTKTGGVLLDVRLRDFQWWNVDDLVIVRPNPSTAKAK